MNDDYYAILGVARSATADEIKKAYRRLALEWHPDRNKSASATEKFKKINEAFAVLSDPQKRQSYDQFGTAGVSGAHPNARYSYNVDLNDIFSQFGGDYQNPFDIFEAFFGFRNPNKKPHAVYHLRLSFDEAITGVEKEVEIEGQRRKIAIPAGIDSGTRINYSTFSLVLDVEPSKQFQRDGQDLYYELPLSYPKAILGTTVSVPTLQKAVDVRIKPGTQPGTMIRLRGFGIPYPRSNNKGDLYIVVKVAIPARVSGKEKKLLEEIAKL